MSPRLTRGLAIALVVSIALNMFLGGMIASAWIARRHFQNEFRPGGESGAMAGPSEMRRGLTKLDPAARQTARRELESHRDALRQAGGDMLRARRDLQEILRQDEIDPAALDKAFAEIRRTSDAAQAETHRALADIVIQLPPDQRRRFLEAALRRGTGGDRRPDGPEPGN